jgi:hypothetical protein
MFLAGKLVLCGGHTGHTIMQFVRSTLNWMFLTGDPIRPWRPPLAPTRVCHGVTQKPFDKLTDLTCTANVTRMSACNPNPLMGIPPRDLTLDSIIITTMMISTRFQSEDQVCISTTLRELDKSVLTQTCAGDSTRSWQPPLTPRGVGTT